jgi:tRNA U54 and U55 pseudouridine synthase Pus10
MNGLSTSLIRPVVMILFAFRQMFVSVQIESVRIEYRTYIKHGYPSGPAR